MLASVTDRSSLDVPLVRLIRESEHFSDVKTVPAEVDVVRAVQKHLPDVLEARILVSSPQNPAWYSSGSRSDTTGGYEIRRKDWESVRSIAPPLRKQDWDARAVYLVCVQLFSTSSPMNLSMDRVLTAPGVSGETATTRPIRSSSLSFRLVTPQQPKRLSLRRGPGCQA